MKKTILLLALSTFPYSKDDKIYTISHGNTFVFEDDNEISNIEVEGYYQLEPVPNLLKAMGQTIDYVIMFSTEGTRKYEFIETKDDYVNESPESYFSGWIKTNFRDSEGKEVKCKSILISELDPSKGIQDAITYIEQISKDYEIELIMDTHGGFRSISLIIQAIAHLWQKNLFDMTVYDVMNHTVISESGKEKKKLIKKSKASYMFDFVSGITEFTNYGRIDSLQRIFEGGTDFCHRKQSISLSD